MFQLKTPRQGNTADHSGKGITLPEAKVIDKDMSNPTGGL